MPRFTHRKVIPIGATARVVAQRAPETLTLVRHRTQSTAETIARLSVTAVFAYLVALPQPGAAQPILAPLTALLVVQVSLYQTLRSAAHRVAAVVIGVLLAIALADLAGFTWWSLGLTIAAGLAVGSALHLGDAVLEVTSGAGSPRCCAGWPPRSPRTADSPPSTTPPRTTGWRPSWSGTWPRPVTSRTGWAS
jgi:Aromatic acid exporter family member 1